MKKMKTISKIILTIGIVGTLVGCKSTFNAPETMQVEENRNAIYQEIISNPVQLTSFISEAWKNEEAKKILMKSHMESMESGNMKMMMDKNPEMKKKMQAHMQQMMEKNPEMKKKMQSNMLDRMMESKKGRKMLMERMHNNDMMKTEMKERMKKMMEKNPDMMKEMMGKMKNNKK
tara:strand:- start:696 stop:1220 length:525 start_codon:yes stop_codon:yes gene_type:complete